jgi:hypothetical protein
MEMETIQLYEEGDKTEAEYLYDVKLIDAMFPDANFNISVDIKELERVISNKNHIIIKQDFDCYCYDNCGRDTKYFHIRGKNMTLKYIIRNLISQGLELDCNHNFLEGIQLCKNTENQFELWLGS